ncbi:cache domain-containing protein [Cupriavidus sp. MP-37]|uniref:cache domain-containing protein n=1 Tax=Cupriavidus sp. MP-37 TaxID=2884455 RepID=UPI001D0BBE7B|nr:cache domain-containing protein [Cupriavidus sp. MP-37]UDM53234.1 cache domain-containing protein [Cupriavidus sp. MP-37]
MKTVALSAAFMLVVFLLVTWMVSYQMVSHSRQDRKQVQAVYVASKEKELRHYVELGHATLARIAQGSGEEAALQQQVLAALSRMHFGNDGYFFVYDRFGNVLLNPGSMGIDGVDFCDPADSGSDQARMLINQAHAGGGIVRYNWIKPSSRAEAPKMSYVRTADQWGWVIGAGLYMDDIERELAAFDANAARTLRDTQIRLTAFAIGSVMLISLAGLAWNLRNSRISGEKLRRLARRVVSSQEEERARVARELHDGVVQVLVSSKYLLETAQVHLEQDPATDADKDRQSSRRHVPQALLAQGLGRLQEALVEIRRVSHGLHPALLTDLGLAAALRMLVEQMRPQRTVELRFTEQGVIPPLSQSQRTALFRVAQEALNNALTHAHAGWVQVTLAGSGHHVALTVEDNGHGFDLNKVRADGKGGIGLRNMRERIESLEGSDFAVHTGPDGTRVEARLRLPPPEPEAHIRTRPKRRLGHHSPARRPAA